MVGTFVTQLCFHFSQYRSHLHAVLGRVGFDQCHPVAFTKHHFELEL